MFKVFLLSWPLSGGKRLFVNGLNNNRHGDDLLGQIVYRPMYKLVAKNAVLFRVQL